MIDKYINYLRNIRGYSDNTCKGYDKDLRHFANWLRINREGARWSTVTMHDIDAYITDRVNAGAKPATTNRCLAAISGLYNYFRREGMITNNPCKFESRRKRSITIPNTIKTEELKTAWENAHGVVKVMIGLLSSTGIRIQELLDMTYEDIDFDTQSIRVHGKGAKERIVYTLPVHLTTLHTVYHMYHKTGRIFTMGQRDARRMIYNALYPYCNAPQLSPHAIRHTFATSAAAMGNNCTQIAHVLGHNDIQTTQKYIDLTQVADRATSQNMALF